MIDTHIHILPGLDDGAANDEMAIKMADVAVSDGISSVICTPHDLNFVYENSRSSILKSVNHLQNLLEYNGKELKVYAGAELHIGPDLTNRVLNGEALTLADKNKHVLVEFPTHFLPYGADSILETLLYHKLTPIIAHPERNPVLVVKPAIFSEWINWGCKAQLTAMSVTGEFGKKIQIVCKSWCQQGLIHLVASDAHRATGRAPKLSLAYQTLCEWMGLEGANLLTKINPGNIIDGQPLISVTPVTKEQTNKPGAKSGIFSFFERKK